MNRLDAHEIAKIKPVGEYVLIRPDVQDKTAEVKTAGGLIVSAAIADSETGVPSYKGPARGKIVEISDKLQKRGTPFKIGDKVIYEKLTEYSVYIGNERFILMKEETIYGVAE